MPSRFASALMVTNTATGQRLHVSAAAPLRSDMLFGHFVLDDGDWAAMSAGLPGSWREQMVFFDRDWNRQKFNYIVPYTEPDVPRPQNLEKMIQLSETLSAGFPCVRVDLYQLADGTIQFGEMTFTTYGGIPEWHPASANRMMGDLIHLPGIDDAPAGTP